ncbi:hypothetical protein WJ972_09695 [Achromobacter insuavis]
MDHALMEIEAQVGVSLRQYCEAPVFPGQVREASDHGRLYAQRRYFRRADHLVAPPLPADGDCTDVRDWHALLDRLRRAGQRLIAVDLSDGAPQGRPPRGRSCRA